MAYQYYLLTWVEEEDGWRILDQCEADGYSPACRFFGVDYDEAQGSFVRRVAYHDSLEKYQIINPEVIEERNP